MEPEVEYFDLSEVWLYTMSFFADIFEWLFSHGFHIYNYYISFGEVLVTSAVLTAFFWVCLPWFTDNDYEWVDDDYYDNSPVDDDYD